MLIASFFLSVGCNTLIMEPTDIPCECVNQKFWYDLLYIFYFLFFTFILLIMNPLFHLSFEIHLKLNRFIKIPCFQLLCFPIIFSPGNVHIHFKNMFISVWTLL